MADGHGTVFGYGYMSVFYGAYIRAEQDYGFTSDTFHESWRLGIVIPVTLWIDLSDNSNSTTLLSPRLRVSISPLNK